MPVTRTLTWDVPVTRQNGAPLAPGDIASYNIYKHNGPAGTPFPTTPFIANVMSNSISVTFTAEQFWAVTAVDTDGFEGVKSPTLVTNEANLINPPAAPTNVHVIV